MATARSSSVLISTTEELKKSVSTISTSNTLYLDLEGKSLGRNGIICIVSIFVYPEQVVRLIDVTTLGKEAFTTTGTNGKTFKSILEDGSIAKCICDCRNDADALLSLYQVSLNGVSDIQLLEDATRTGPRSYLCGLAKAIEMDLKLKYANRALWMATKNAVTAKMSTDIFATRPIDDQTLQYCVNDLIHLPALLVVYRGRLTGDWATKVIDATRNRLLEVQSPLYQPQSEEKKFGPWGPGNGKNTLTWDEWEDVLQEQAEDTAQDFEDLDDMYDDEYDDAQDLHDEMSGQSDDIAYRGAFDECWDKN